ncbi:glucans biosynthesis glucosyltransferase MdoH [Chromatocurvus halotolerans]|uniref:Glucans biosynthesis glucosyltransferase H n=1 Tax=Chromatocurvus halotolerans TaxID=1132028 RepID=A0A4R2KS24_9GAMM|nr:glucans biosynthesis glucosyltransferase MdoH [Chromatocurvus halotolerans]TCO75587.1 membrane glycosyltransferase [Chromatocurvus halotolerans]
MTSALSSTPPASPLAMPTQVLSRRPARFDASPDPLTILARAITFGGSLALTAGACYQLYRIIPLDEAATLAAPARLWLTFLLWLLLFLFTTTFAWISLSATGALAGLLSVCHLSGSTRRQRHPGADTALRGRTVLIMPIYNEDAISACAALAAMGEDLARTGLQGHFEIFILSDSNAADVLATEQAAAQYLRDHLRGTMPVWYRRREHNSERKAGNIRDFVNRWGDSYDYMVVLDADSLIAGETLVALVREMDADPASGILQTLPRLHGGKTLFARLQQFAGIAYGPVFSRGLCAWQGHDGNYWGHNAIIRTRAFAASAGLPVLPGRRPFAGEIRSHDFVEAALMRRAGWSVRMLPELAHSWEECPTTLLDAAIRDRRWAQGNVQHLAVVSARGLRWPSRAHMLMGVMNYLTSLLWLAMVTLGLVLSTQFALPQPGLLPVENLPVFDSKGMIGLFIFTMALLLLPKMLGLASGLLTPEMRGGMGRLTFFCSVLLELLFSVLHAPIFMLIHSRHLWDILHGQDSGWSAQRRQESGIHWRQLLMSHGTHTVVGILLLSLLLWLPSSLLYWMLPIIVGLLLAVPLSALGGSQAAGQWLERRGLLGIPEERALPEIMQRRHALLDACEPIITARAARTATPSV